MKRPPRQKKSRRFGVYDVLVTDEDRIRFDIRELARRLRDGSEKSTDRANAASKLELLAGHPSMLSVLGARYAAPDVYYWLAYHAVLCELLGVKLRLQRVAEFWSKSAETVQDALTDRRAGLLVEVKREVEDWSAQGFAPAEILESIEGTRLSAAKDFITGRKRQRTVQRRKK